MPSIDRITTSGGQVRYRARYRAPDGGSRSRRFTQRREAVAFLASVETAKSTGRYVDPQEGRVTVAGYSATWCEGRMWRPSSRVVIEGTIRTHILPTLGPRELRSLRPSELQAWVRRHSEARSPSTVRRAAWALKSLLESAGT